MESIGVDFILLLFMSLDLSKVRGDLGNNALYAEFEE